MCPVGGDGDQREICPPVEETGGDGADAGMGNDGVACGMLGRPSERELFLHGMVGVAGGFDADLWARILLRISKSLAAVLRAGFISAFRAGNDTKPRIYIRGCRGRWKCVSTCQRRRTFDPGNHAWAGDSGKYSAVGGIVSGRRDCLERSPRKTGRLRLGVRADFHPAQYSLVARMVRIVRPDANPGLRGADHGHHLFAQDGMSRSAGCPDFIELSALPAWP